MTHPLRRALLALALMTGIAPALGQVPSFPQTIPTDTFVGRIQPGSGPSSAVPISSLLARIINLNPNSASNSLLFTPFPPPAIRASTVLGFDANGNLAYLPLAPTISVTAGSTFNTQGLAAAASISVTVQFVQTAGYAAAGDGGGALYGKASGTTPCGFQSADGQWWTPDFTRGFNLRVCGAGLGNGTADVAAMTAASQFLGPLNNVGVSTGPNILIPPGNYDFSTGSFLFTRDGTRILCGGFSTTAIKFNPAATASLFTFFRSGDANGIGNSEISDCRIYSTNTVQKTILTISNATGFILRRNFMFGITDAGGHSIAILYQGRNWFIHEDNFITADFPFFFNTNPDRALAGFEDADFTSGARNQYATEQTNGAIYTVQTGLNITNWTAKNEDWAGGQRGVDCVDTTATGNSSIWTFENIRREQSTGVNPTMFVIVRSGVGKLRDLRVISPSVDTGQLANLSGIDRASFVKPFFNTDGTLILTADSTVANLNWTGMFASAGNTLGLTGQTLVRGREKLGGTDAAPIYMDATYTNIPQGTIEWIGAPSANGHRVGLWRTVADVPVHSGSNDFILLPWTLYTIQQAQITVNGPGTSGIATFLIGQTAPAGNTVLIGQSGFAVDGGAGHLSVFHFSDTSVGIINKLAGAATVTVEVLFTQQ